MAVLSIHVKIALLIATTVVAAGLCVLLVENLVWLELGNSQPLKDSVKVTVADYHHWLVVSPGQKIDFQLGDPLAWQRPWVDGPGMVRIGKSEWIVQSFAHSDDTAGIASRSGAIVYPHWWCLRRSLDCSFLVYFYVRNPAVPAGAAAYLPNDAVVIR